MSIKNDEKYLRLHYSEVHSKELELLECGKEKNAPNKHIGPYVRDIYLLHYCAEGKGFYVCNGEEFEITRGDIFFIRPGDTVEYYPDHENPWTYIWIGFNGEMAENFIIKTYLNEQKVIRSSSSAVKSYFYQIADLYNECGVLNISTYGYLYLILGALEKKEENQIVTAKERYVREAIKYIMYNIENDIKIESIADSLQIAPTYFINIFTEVIGVSPKKYLSDCRLNRACELLKQGMTTNTIYTRCGFRKRESFIKAFKRKYNMLPKEYKKIN